MYSSNNIRVTLLSECLNKGTLYTIDKIQGSLFTDSSLLNSLQTISKLNTTLFTSINTVFEDIAQLSSSGYFLLDDGSRLMFDDSSLIYFTYSS